jgi:hypothetical protein
MGLHLRSIRQRILLLVLVPVLSLIGLYAYSTAVFSTQAISLARTNVLKNSTAQWPGTSRGRDRAPAGPGVPGPAHRGRADPAEGREAKTRAPHWP